MVPVLMKGGRSFKGAAAYYLHDKRQPGEVERSTSDRVAWTHTVNLPTDDPEKAWRMMAHTAMAQAELKAAAGIKATGRKLTQPVCSYVLSWHEDDRPSQEEQLKCALETLKVLGLDDRQAVIVAHNDTRHSHVHIIANRVSPENGIAAKLDNSINKLTEWANEYEKAQGKVRCDARAEKAKKREQGEPVKPSPRVSRPVHEFQKTAGNDNIRADYIKAEQARKDAALNQAARAMHQNHRQQWQQGKDTWAQTKAKLADFRTQAEAQTTERIKDQFKTQWADLFKRQERERKELARQSATVTGRLKRWLSDKVTSRFDGENGQKRGLLSGAFRAAVSSDSLRRAQDLRHEAERKSLAQYRKEVTARAMKPIREQHRASMDRLRGKYVDLCAELKQSQEADKARMQEQWRQRNAERAEAFAPMRGRDQAQEQDRAADRPEEGRATDRAQGDQGRDSRPDFGRDRGRGLG